MIAHLVTRAGYCAASTHIPPYVANVMGDQNDFTNLQLIEDAGEVARACAIFS